MSANQAAFPVSTMARVLGVSKAGFYAWRDRAPSARQVADEALLVRVQNVHAASRDTYGAPRVHAALKAKGERHGRKRIARLMRDAGFVGACHRGSGPTTTRRDEKARPAPDLVDRNFKAQAPDQLWVADITYVPTMSGFLYLAVVLDVFSRRIVGWSMANHLRTELIVNALDMAVGQRKPKDVIHHSDQGCQGGLKRSSQRPFQGGDDGGSQATFRSVRTRENALARAPFRGPARRARSVLDVDRGGAVERGGCAGRRGVAAGRRTVVPAGWRPAAVSPRTGVQAHVRSIPSLHGTRAARVAARPGSWRAGHRASPQAGAVHDLA